MTDGRPGSARPTTCTRCSSGSSTPAGFQCGFCTAGHGRHRRWSALDRRRRPRDLPRLLKGNLCRCTGYRSIARRARRRRQHRERARPDAGPLGAAPRPAARVVTGTRAVHPRRARRPACCTSPCCGSPHAHARIVVDRHAAAAGAARRARWCSPTTTSRVAVLHRPATRTGSTTPTTPDARPASLRFRGQRVAAVVAESLAAAEAACRADRRSSTRCCPRSSTPGGTRAGRARWCTATRARRRGSRTRRATSSRELHGGDRRRRRRASPRPRTRVVAGTWRTQPRGARRAGDPRRPSAGSTTTAGWWCAPAPRCRSWSATSSRRILGARPRDQVRVLTGRVGGGFGGKQELLTEDLVALAVLRTGPPGAVGAAPARTSSRSCAVPAPDPGRGRAGRRRRRGADRAAPSTC